MVQSLIIMVHGGVLKANYIVQYSTACSFQFSSAGVNTHAHTHASTQTHTNGFLAKNYLSLLFYNIVELLRWIVIIDTFHIFPFY